MLYLLKYADNWADEMDISGFTILDEMEYQEFRRGLDNLEEDFREFTMYIGSNEEIEYEDIDQVHDAFEVEEITETDREILNRLGLTDGDFSNFAYTFVECIGEFAYDEEDDN